MKLIPLGLSFLSLSWEDKLKFIRTYRKKREMFLLSQIKINNKKKPSFVIPASDTEKELSKLFGLSVAELRILMK